jgi:hypothetical protein
MNTRLSGWPLTCRASAQSLNQRCQIGGQIGCKFHPLARFGVVKPQ